MHKQPLVTLLELEADRMGPECTSLRKLKRDVRRELGHIFFETIHSIVSEANRNTQGQVQIFRAVVSTVSQGTWNY